MDWKLSESTIRPLKVDDTSSKTTTYFRRNIKEEKRSDTTWFVYEEATMPKEDYHEILVCTEEISANIDYLAMMTDVELPEV